MTTRSSQTRIPVFGTRTSTPHTPLHDVLPTNSPAKPTTSDVGKKVRVADRDEGTLRFIGDVHFAPGVWCGVELFSAVGKNDGIVRGVRYFACPPSRGLMAPLAKVVLVEEETDEVSGPYSILLGLERDEEVGVGRRLIRQGTFDKDESCDSFLTARSSLGSDSFDFDCLELKDRRGTVTIHTKGVFYKNEKNSSNSLDHSCVIKGDETFLAHNETYACQTDHNTTNVLNLSNKRRSDDLYKSCTNTSSPHISRLSFGKCSKSTPNSDAKSEIPTYFNVPLMVDDDGSKRDSLELEESLGILTPDQMNDYTCFLSNNCSSRTPSSENLRSLPLDVLLKHPDPPSPLASQQEASLGIIDEKVLANARFDSILNMELPLPNSVPITRLEETPSPEELPLDPTPVVESQPTKTTTSKSQTAFIASISSITSLDTGYQGDGEMSRPASRGADNSPMTRRPLPRPQPRRPDPMTDSDFYTESDADNHEDHPLRGDRRAQVIDGTLYGVDPQATADIYVNNRENMDSSGIFTDIETRTEELSMAEPPKEPDVSPSDTSSKTISDNSQNHAVPVVHNSQTKNDAPQATPTKSSDLKRSATPSSIMSSPSSVRSPRHASKNESPPKKYKMPKRNVVSKVKAMMEPGVQTGEARKDKVKPVGRWDAVMNKISKNPEESKVKLKEVKSKVFSSAPAPKVLERKGSSRPPQKSPNVKPHRTRHRLPATSTTSKKPGESVHSSLSDLSGASPAKKSPPKKNAYALPAEARVPKKIFNKEKKQIATKECNRGTVKGGRAPPSVRPPTQTRAPSKQLSPPPVAVPRTSEALAVLVQHLVFNLDAFRGPSLRKEAERSRTEAQKSRLEAEESRLMCQHLEEAMASKIEEERAHFRSEIAELIEQHRTQIEQFKKQVADAEQQKYEMETSVRQTQKNLEETLSKMKLEFNKLQNTHEESLEILREENDSIRDELDEKEAALKKLEDERKKWQNQFDTKEIQYKEQLKLAKEEVERLHNETTHTVVTGDEKTVQEVESLRAVLELKQSEVQELRRALAEANQKVDQIPLYEEKVNTLNARCEDLELRLERKNEYTRNVLLEKSKLEESYKEECNQKKRLCQYNEELQWRLKQNKEVVSQVLEQAEEGSFNRSLFTSSFNERHASTNTKPDLERSFSYRERSFSNKSNVSSEGMNRSRKSKNSSELELDDMSPPNSPKVKGIVEKSDSVSYVLDLDESPEIVASRIVRRSFRNTTPPKNTPTKSPANKRPRMKSNPLSLSASASSIVQNKQEYVRSRSVSVRNGESDTGSNNSSDDYFIWTVQGCSSPKNRSGEKTLRLEEHDLYEEDDIDIPALPSEIGRKSSLETLPMSVTSASNSDDESTSSSSVQL